MIALGVSVLNVTQNIRQLCPPRRQTDSFKTVEVTINVSSTKNHSENILKRTVYIPELLAIEMTKSLHI